MNAEENARRKKDGPKLQRSVRSRRLAPPRGSLVVLEAETGAGKTEAALDHYLRLLFR